MNQDVLKIQVFTKAILIQHVQNVINKYCFLYINLSGRCVCVCCASFLLYICMSELYILQVQ
jgi:hypothetical protein